jgi:hypothetical protein
MDPPRISLKIDLRSGVIELDAPAENFEQAIAQTKDLTGSLDFAAAMEAEVKGAGAGGSESDNSSPETSRSASTNARSPSASARKSRNGKGSSSRTGRIGSFEEVRGLLTEAQEIELREFFTEKAPPEQPHQALVAIVKGEQLLGRRGFSYNEIYTLMWLGGVKDLPKALDVVLLKLMQDQMVVREEGGFAAKFVGRNFVDHELPRSS